MTMRELAKRRGLAASLVLVLAVLALKAHSAVDSRPYSLEPIDLIRSDSDQRQYAALTLANGIQVFLISDALASKATAALDVGVGSGEDPETRQGLAHFLEHMLFLGTEKYPAADDFQKFIAESGGEYNAYTGLHNTNYYFDVYAAHFASALDRFAQFFISPLFAEKYTERELFSVHSEYTSKIGDDQRREQDVLRELVLPGHPLGKFSTGNQQTLRRGDQASLRQDLLAFYRHHYVANRMTLVLSGPFDLAVLRRLAEEKFAAVPKANPQAGQYAEHSLSPALFANNFLPAEVHIQPKKEVRKLQLIFPLPDSEALRHIKPVDYLANFIGHEGKGSLIWLFRNKGWATGLNAGIHRRWQSGDNFAGGETFGISVFLTPSGMENLPAVRALVFDYIKRLKKSGISQWRYDEISQIQRAAFRYLEEQDSMFEASAIARNLQTLPPEQVFWAAYQWNEFNAHVIADFLARLVPENTLTLVVAPDLPTDRTSEYYSAPYKIVTTKNSSKDSVFTEIKNKKEYQQLAAVLALPRKNPYFKKNQPLCRTCEVGASAAAPKKIVTQAGNTLQAWYVRDDIFSIPKVSIKARCVIADTYVSPDAYAAATVFLDIVNESLIEKNYTASLAGLSYSLAANSQGFNLEFYGYSQGLYDFARDVIAELDKFTQRKSYRQYLLRQYFNNAKRDVLRQLQNAQFDKAYVQVFGDMPAWLYHPYWSRNDVIASINNLTVASFDAWVASSSQPESCAALAYGNLDEAQAQRYFKQVSRLLDEKKSSVQAVAAKPVTVKPVTKVVKTFGEQSFLRISENRSDDEVVVRYIQGRSNALRERALLLILLKSISAPFYHSLRTEQQLGYVVMTSSYKLKDVPGFVAVVQSPRVNAQEIHQRMQQFFSSNKARVLESFDASKQAILQSLSEPKKTQADWAHFYWQSILDRDENFDSDQRLIEILHTLREEDVSDLYDAVFDEARMALFIASKHAIDSASFGKNLEILDDYKEFKQQLPAYEYLN